MSKVINNNQATKTNKMQNNDMQKFLKFLLALWVAAVLFIMNNKINETHDYIDELHTQIHQLNDDIIVLKRSTSSVTERLKTYGLPYVEDVNTYLYGTSVSPVVTSVEDTVETIHAMPVITKFIASTKARFDSMWT